MTQDTSTLEHVGTEEEVSFWQGFLQTKRFELNWLKATPNPELDIEADLLIRGLAAYRDPATPVRLLDVGSGPVSHFSNGFTDLPVEPHAADPLADHYNALWDHPLKAKACTPVTCAGERLSTVFEAGFFDVVHIRNAIDHVVNPIEVLEEAAKVTKSGGYVMVHGWEDEAMHQGYRGMHQWSMRLDNKVPDLLFVAKDKTVLSVRERLEGKANFVRVWNKAKPKKERIWSGALLQVI